MAHRSDVGVFTDPYAESKSFGGNLGAELDFGPGFDLGVNAGANWSNSYTDKWEAGGSDAQKANHNEFYERFKYSDNESSKPEYEQYYFTAGGEMSAEPVNTHDNIAGDKAASVVLSGSFPESTRAKHNLTTGLRTRNHGQQYNQDGPVVDVTKPLMRDKRKPRSSSIQFFKNEDAAKMEEFNTASYSDGGTDTKLAVDRTLKPQHIGGIIALQPNGARYVYGLPIANLKQEEYTYSIPEVPIENVDKQTKISVASNDGYAINYKHPNGDEYFDKTATPQYYHSHLLTSVLGADYVDLDRNEAGKKGPSDGDQGYWVKFDYKKTASATKPYKWRAPYTKGSYNKGQRTNLKDDRASFTYGEREQYYLKIAETKTHKAIFYSSKRDDARGAEGVLQNDASSTIGEGNESYKLDSIILYSKAQIEKPLQTIILNYAAPNRSLCKGVENAGQGNGKLTLLSISFKNEGSSRAFSYELYYDYGNSSIGDIGFNPPYSEFAFDRWGNYRSWWKDVNNAAKNTNFPYSVQMPSTVGMGNDWFSFEAQVHKNASAWHLTNIKLPSGAYIKVDYESDDYAYVQDRVAMQMFKIASVGSYEKIPNKPDLPSKKVYGDFEDLKNNLRIYFDLENTAIPLGIAAQKEFIKKYVEDLHLMGTDRQIFYKVRVNLEIEKNPEADSPPPAYEDISGYAIMDGDNYGLEQINNEWKGYIQLKPAVSENAVSGVTEVHPFSMNAWQLLKAEHGDILNNGTPVTGTDRNAFSKLIGTITNLGSIFKSYYGKCKDDKRGRTIDLDNSFIRLNTPDKKKFGGGVRVKKVEMSDNWGEGGSDAVKGYGITYDYTKKDVDGKIISSGVATNEPSIGYEECALKYAKAMYSEKAYFKSSDNYFFEYPIDETYYPAPSVGYSQVTVKSLATEKVLKDGNAQGTGETVHEFYTAKDFPVLVEETVLDKHIPGPRWIPILIGVLKWDDFTGSQGYAVTLNDMHGKPKSVTLYGLDKEGKSIRASDPDRFVNRTVYKYQEKDSDISSATGKPTTKTLNNLVQVLLPESENYYKLSADPNVGGVSDINNPKYELGVEREFFTDVRQMKTRTGSGSISFNADFTVPFIFWATLWPGFSLDNSTTRTVVTNKIIRKVGILSSVENYDGQSKVVTDNLVFDPLTGESLLTSVDNSFKDKIYNFKLPARYVYEGMGAAYENWGIRFGTFFNNDGSRKICAYPEIAKILKPGDEFLVKKQEGSTYSNPILEAAIGGTVRVVYLGSPFTIESIKISKDGEIDKFKDYACFDASAFVAVDKISSGVLDNLGPYQFYLIRSGKRNQLAVPAANIVSLNEKPFRIGDGKYEFNKIINSTAQSFSDTWSVTTDEKFDIGSQSITNPYAIGEKGIWRADKSFVYIENRLANENIDLKNAGTYDGVSAFDWHNPLFMDTPEGKKWKMTSEITQYHRNGSESESRDILGKYSSALFGYGNNLSTAVAANARSGEIGFEGFEDLQPYNTEGGIDFPGSNYGDFDLSETYNIIGVNPANKRKIYIDKSSLNGINTGVPVTATLYLAKKNETSKILNESSVTTNLVNKPVDINLFNRNQVVELTLTQELESGYGGKIVLRYRKFKTSNKTELISLNTAHTGKKSLKIASPTDFIQNSLRLEHNKQYAISAWVKVTNPPPSITPINTHAYDGNTNYIGVKIGTETMQKFKPTGEIIEGWQRIEGVFKYDEGSTWLIHFEGESANVYFDDVRIFPKDAEMQTYVYNPLNYRLSAALDNNNFATFYYYDEEGKLFLTKKETARGIKTIQESKNFTRGSRY